FSAASDSLTTNQMESKLDWNASTKNRLFLGLSLREYEARAANGYGTIADTTYGSNGDSIPARGLRLDYTRTQTPTLILNSRFGISRMERNTPPPATPPGWQITELGFPQSLQNQMVQPVAFPYTTVAGYSDLGNATAAFVFLSFTTYSWNGNATWVHGKHTF